MKYISIILLLTFSGCFFSCKKIDKTSRLYILTNGNFKYWDLKSRHGSGYVGAYRFGKDGSCYYTYYSRQASKRVYAHAFDVVPYDHWELMSNDSINVCGYKYKILFIDADSMAILSPYRQDTMIMITSPNQKDEQVFPPKEGDEILL